MNKKKFFIVAMFLTIVCGFSTNDVDALTIRALTCSEPYDINMTTYDNYTIWGDHGYSEDNSWKFNLMDGDSIGRIVYCSAKGVPIDTEGGSYVSYQSLDTDNNINNLMARVLAYGYIGNNDENCSVARIGTQVVVHMAAKQIATGNGDWLNLSASQIANMFSGSYKNDIGNYAYDLKEKVKTHGVVPSFSKNTTSEATSDSNRIELKYDEATYSFSNDQNLLVDTSSVLSTYSVSSPSELIKAEKVNNSLKITSYNDKVTEPVAMSKVFPSESTVYRRVVGDTQPTVYSSKPVDKTRTVYAGYRYEVVGKGRIGIHKI